GIPTVLLVGNHDVAPAAGRAHTIQEFKTFDIPYIHVADRPALIGPAELGIPLQIVAVPWIARGAVMVREEMAGRTHDEVTALIEEKVSELVEQLIELADPAMPLVLAAHASVQGARYGSERAVMLGHELVLSGQVVGDRRIDYVALGHIHKHQSLNDGRQPPIVYAGSIERIDFGEAREQKGFVLARVGRHKTDWRFVPLNTRRFLDLRLVTDSADSFMDDVMRQLPDPEEVAGAICRVQLTYPRDWEPLIDEAAIAERFKLALSFHIQKHREFTNRSRLGDTVAVEALSPEELLAQYWQTIGLDEKEAIAMQTLAKEVLGDVEH
ncbi:MAG: metallophosphoesterase family protein, partial [Candidatus Promineifilaceae bacterium]